jgi:dienelactone hydrolase
MGRTRQSLAYPGGDFDGWRRKLRIRLKELLGDFPSVKCPLEPRRIWKRAHPLGTIEKIVFRSEPYADVPAYVCIPKGLKVPYPFMVCLQGHSTGMHNSIGVALGAETRRIKVEGDRDFAMGCMKNGFAAICIEQRSFGERSEKKQKKVSSNGCHDATMHALMLGRTLMGERIYDVERTLDYLAVRGDADMGRIGVMGNSGGGMISLFSAAILPGISFAMPSCYFCTFKDSIMSIYHCADNYVPGLLKYAEMSDVAGLIAPRPLVIVAGREDDIFPVAATRRSFAKLKRIYRAAGADGKCKLVVGEGGHRFYADIAWKELKRQLSA